jgi:hypothetical protein
VVLHDEIAMAYDPSPYHAVGHETSLSEEWLDAGPAIMGVGPVLTGFGFFADRREMLPIADMESSPALLEIAAKFANAV